MGEGWRRLYNEKLYDLYFWPNIIQIKKNEMGGKFGMGERIGAYRVWWEDLRERRHLQDIGGNGIIILKYTFKKWDEEPRTGLIGLRTVTVGGRL